MPISTFLKPKDFTKPTSDNEINYTLKKVREITGHDFRVEEIVVTKKRFLKSNKMVYLYSLYVKLKEAEYQIINFYNPDGESSICTNVNASIIVAYLYGLLNGLHSKKKSK